MCISVMAFTGGPTGDPISKQGRNVIGTRRDRGSGNDVTGITQFSLGGDTSAPFAMAYVGTNGHVFNNSIIPDLRGADNVFVGLVTELIADITAGVQVLLGQR